MNVKKNEENDKIFLNYIKNMELKYCVSPIIKTLKSHSKEIIKINLFEDNVNENNDIYFLNGIQNNNFFINNNINNDKCFYPYLNSINNEKDFINNKNNKKTILKLLLINSIKI